MRRRRRRGERVSSGKSLLSIICGAVKSRAFRIQFSPGCGSRGWGEVLVVWYLLSLALGGPRTG